MLRANATPPADGLTSRAFWFAAIITAVLFLTGIVAPYFIVDSWSYLELSRTVFTDFYRFNTLRHYESLSPYSQAFPPLWPVLLAVVRRVMDLGIYTGYLLNVFACIALLTVLIRLFQRLNLPGWAGAACYLSLLAYPSFLGEALGAKSMPLALACLTGALLLLVTPGPVPVPRVALAGLLMGIACLTRFDALATACLIGVAFAGSAYSFSGALRQAAIVAAVYFIALGAALSPMAAYGISHFGKLFPSDNTVMVMQARGGTVLDYNVRPPASDLREHPGAWIAGLLFYKAPKVLIAGFYESAVDSPLPVLLAAVLVIWGAGHSPRLKGPAARFVVLALILTPVLLLPAVLAGLLDSRYYSGPLLLLFAVTFAVLVSLTPDAWDRRRATLLLLVLGLSLGPALARPLIVYQNSPGSLAAGMAPLSPTPAMRQLTDAVHRDSGGRAHCLILTAGHVAAAKYGALTGEPVAVMPRLASGTFADFARDWHITHVYDGPIDKRPWESGGDSASVMRVINSGGVVLVPLDLPGLYRIQLTEAQSSR